MENSKKNILKSFLFVCFGLITAIVFTSARPFDVPSRPGRPEITDIRNDQCDISFEKPESDGGSRITGYLIECLDLEVGIWVNKGMTTSRSSTVKMLTEGTEVVFRVTAFNAGGPGEPSYPSNSVVIRGPFQP